MKSPPVNDLLFTYGTLRRAAGNAAHRLLADSAELVGHGAVQGQLYQATGFPVLVPNSQGVAVTGEVYRVFSEEELHGLKDDLAWLKAAERSFEFWDNEEDAAYDNV